MSAPETYRGSASRARRSGGFTLLELVVVVFILGIVAAITIPQVLPLILYSTLEGSARHLSDFGRAAISHATMLRRPITIRFDLSRQEYWAVELVYPGDGEEADPAALEKKLEMYEKVASLRDRSPEAMMKQMTSGNLDGLADQLMEEQIDLHFNDAFARFSRESTLQRAKNVKHDTGILDGIGNLFDKPFSLEKETEPEERELADPVLQRTYLPDGVRIDGITIGGESQGRGVVEVPLSPLGLESEVRFFLSSSDRESFTVVWDPASGSTNVMSGKVTR